MRDIIFQVHVAFSDEAEVFIECLQVQLCADADDVVRVCVFLILNCFFHQLLSELLFSEVGMYHYAADGAAVGVGDIGW